MDTDTEQDRGRASRSESGPEIGPQYGRDDAFTRRMRFHQSWYRARVLKAPVGTGPKAGNTTRYGNMLTAQDGDRGLNFLTRHIFEVAKRREAVKKGAVDRFRLRCNMLSSQPMCFNLFGLLVDDAELATRLLQALLPGEVQAVTRVELEYAPEPVSQYLNDLTAFDAFAAYRRLDGEAGFVGIETKLAEGFSEKVYTNPRYVERMNQPGASWRPEMLHRLQQPDVNQLWRGHLLAFALRRSSPVPFAAGRFMLVYHPGNSACREAAAAYQNLLRPEDDSFVALPLDEVVRRWGEAVETPAQREWLQAFSLRYLDLEASEAEFQAAL